MQGRFERVRSRLSIDRAANDVHIQNQRLKKARIDIGDHNNAHLSAYLESIPDEDLWVIGKILPDQQQQIWYFGSSYDYQRAVLTARALGSLARWPNADPQVQLENLQKARSAVALFVARLNYDHSKQDTHGTKSFDFYVDIIGRLVLEKQLYQLFDEDPEKLIEKLPKLIDPDNTLSSLYVVESLRMILSHHGSVDDVKSLLDLSREEIQFVLKNPNLFGTFPEAIKSFERFHRSPQDWGDRYIMFHDMAVACGALPLTSHSLDELIVQQISVPARTSYEQKDAAGRYLTLAALRKKWGFDLLRELSNQDPKVLENDERVQQEVSRQISRLENQDLPIITMGIASTHGGEVEFPSIHERITKYIPDAFVEVTAALGVHWGTGGSGCAEIAPGPFYHPETLIAYLQMMQNLGFVDLYKYQGMTLHSNLGVRNEGLSKLILAQYLCNTTSDTSMFTGDSRRNGFEFKIWADRAGEIETYSECKSFLCMTPHELDFGLVQIGYLSWALKCWQCEGELLVTPQRVKQMASVWSRYIQNLDIGARSVSLDGIFGQDFDFLPKRKLNKMIALIHEAMPDYRSRFRDPKSTITPNPVTVGIRKWPNIVAFARSIGDEATQQIKLIEHDINQQAALEIRQLGRSRGENKRGLINRFIQEYRPLSTDRTDEEKLEKIRLTAKALGLENIDI